MGELIIHEDQFTFPWRERARVCPKCKGKGGRIFYQAIRGKPELSGPTRDKIPCVVCNGKGELLLPRIVASLAE